MSAVITHKCGIDCAWDSSCPATGRPPMSLNGALPTTSVDTPKDAIGRSKAALVSVLPPASIIYEAAAMADGAAKYGAYNFRGKKAHAMVYVDALMRHVLAWVDGEENAPDSGLPHLAHAKACLGIIIDTLETGNLVDDRPPAGTAARLLERFKKATP